ncbi:uncharacterized protein MONBRDRAFT_37611 [Monosiga brevicollis MX1]|uniref:Desulfoferrodoxin ferrous iron-binding domain-containing protein n=1 Tax=Monosiga brevicollis TaxID=81824 RepID=A9V2T5_MONBE|nr:uncharacterized protein MONBRDRAFT_37611 [Monosiga brevicollis MX1]EDQ87941.1 predicted protein [Monosiga brevicollis MX1]|eukprot:XP_001747017.1 hypothetical protein [Monosiga brevicollis MX1]
MAASGEIPQAWVDKVKELLGGEIFTKEQPGKWEGKAGGHVPVVSKNDDGTVTVKVPHVMKKGEKDEDDHWIEYVFVQDAEGNIVAMNKFTPTDAAAAISFQPEAGKTLTPFGYCNLHGMWKGEQF